MQVNMLDAKNQLSRLVKAALAGKDVVIASNGKPQVRLVPVAGQHMDKAWGRLKLKDKQIDAAFSSETEARVAGLLLGGR